MYTSILELVNIPLHDFLFAAHDVESHGAGSGGGMDQVAEWMQWRPDWEKESYTEHRDLVLMPVFALVFLSVRYLLDSFIFQVCFAFLFLLYVMQYLLRVPANIMTESFWWIWQCDRNLGHRFFLYNCLHKVLNRLCTYLQSMSGADKISLACCSLNGIAIEFFDLAMSLAWRFLCNFVDMFTKCNSVFQHFVIVSCLCNLPHIWKEPHNSLVRSMHCNAPPLAYASYWHNDP
jgi:hypothetical protein